ncbi:heparinase II/III family protein [Salipiger sp. P9]|uniref:heparinase II/III family protein n=1 Tax=Salipiger pentaromativorans TaxID=2943193 RepID=UPI00215882A1|nr:heparinase II/III family protein [Salipiger pentaromativorans]MCR8546618.1 heparinase II/III family protein [Salipiger pentaromativorans]
MSQNGSCSAAVTRFLNRFHARMATRARPATGFVSQPEPRSTGSFAKGRQLCAGNLMFAGHLVEAPEVMIWDLDTPDAAWEEEIHGFRWLDDLAAVGDARARAVAQKWLWGWILRYGNGRGPGWTPELAGRRLIRSIHHALFVLRGIDSEKSTDFYRALACQTIFLSRRWSSSAPGLPRFEALTGLVYAGLSLQGMGAHVEPARRALGAECARQVDALGGIPTRNPEELLEVFTLLTWTQAALEEGDRQPDEAHLAAIARIAPTLRALRHADGGLARFQGGGRGLDGRLDQALAASGSKKRQADGLAMGYARLSAGRTSVIVDAAPPPGGRASADAHASTLAFELTSGRRPLVVSCGSGAVFGEDWRRAGRATPSHSTLCLDGYSSARLASPRRVGGAERELLEDAPQNVPVQMTPASDGIRFEGGHDGYRKTHGLTHARVLELTFDGRGLVGEDLLMTLSDPDKLLFDRRMDAVKLSGLPWQLRFHLHPEVDAELDMGGSAVSMALRSGEIWVFRFDPGPELTLEPSVYLEKGRLRPRAAKQIVLSGRVMEYATRIRWSLAKAQDTAIAVRDLAMDDADETL